MDKSKIRILITGGTIDDLDYENEEDALFNLGAAFIAVQQLPEGVYIVMNSKIFNWDNVQKNFSTGYFEEK